MISKHLNTVAKLYYYVHIIWNYKFNLNAYGSIIRKKKCFAGYRFHFMYLRQFQQTSQNLVSWEFQNLPHPPSHIGLQHVWETSKSLLRSPVKRPLCNNDFLRTNVLQQMISVVHCIWNNTFHKIRFGAC